MPVELEQRTATKLFHLFLFQKKWLTSPKPTGTDQVNSWGQSENRVSKDQREKRSEKEKKNLVPLQSHSHYLLFFSMTDWAEAPKQHSHPNHLSWFHQPMKVYLKFKLDNIKIGATFGLPILLPLFLEQSHFWNEKRRHHFSRKQVTIKRWLEKDCLVLTETIIEACSITNCNYAAA